MSEQRYHWDIYTILEAPQELYFGHEVEINVNRVEMVKLETKEGRIDKVYFSPTKRRGVERRTLLWSPHKSGKTLGEVLECGIPNTCAKDECPICRVYGALQPGKKTVIGRLTHGGGVAVQELGPEEKQRAMHPSDLVRDSKGETSTPFRREYNQPGTYYPVYNHVLSTSETDFSAAAYAFLNMLPRVGAGNPKGARILQDGSFMYLVLDRYLVPKGKRPIISPHETTIEAALKEFQSSAKAVRDENSDSMFKRWQGDAALKELERLAEVFAQKHLV